MLFSLSLTVCVLESPLLINAEHNEVLVVLISAFSGLQAASVLLFGGMVFDFVIS